MVECEQFLMKDTDKVEKAFHEGSIDLFLAGVRIFFWKELKLSRMKKSF
jgi:hypothetical protein